jgi:hypothetical protein
VSESQEQESFTVKDCYSENAGVKVKS